MIKKYKYQPRWKFGDKEHLPKTLKEALSLWFLTALFLGSIGTGKHFGGWYWALAVIGIVVALYGFWKVRISHDKDGDL